MNDIKKNITHPKTETRPLTTKCSTHYTLTLQQSPKLMSNKFRTNYTINNTNHNQPSKKQEKKLFSLIDINDKITNQRGTTLPAQYQRRNETETNKILTNKENKERQCMTIQAESTKKRRISSAMPGSRFMKLRKKLDKNDTYLPPHFDYYQQLVENPKLITESLSINKFYNDNLYNQSAKEIKERSLNSDVFFRKKLEIDKSINQNEKTNNIYMSSDVFYLNKNVPSFEIQKSGEKYYFNSKNCNNKYTGIKESKSEWSDKKTEVVKIKNLTSTKYNILVPCAKGISISRNEAPKIYNKTKALSEFIDLTRVPAPNYNPEYQKYLKENKKPFRKVHGMCSDYYDSYGNGKNLYSKPFIKEEKPNFS